MGASLVEVDKIRPCRDSHVESAALRAAEAFDRLPQVQLFSRSNQGFSTSGDDIKRRVLHCA